MIAISVPFLLSHNQVQDDTRYLSWSDYIFEIEMALSPFVFHTVEGGIIPRPPIYICLWFFIAVHRIKDSSYFLKAKNG